MSETKRVEKKTEKTKKAEKPKKEKKPNKWHQHVMKFRETHPELSFKEVLRQASKTYKKQKPKKPKKQKKQTKKE
jgi:hypothetical protein